MNIFKCLQSKYKSAKFSCKHNKAYYHSFFTFFMVLVLITVVLLKIFYNNLDKIDKEMLFWLFSASSQSMAAIFAVVGIFAAYRLQFLDNRLRNMYDCLKNKFKSHNLEKIFGARYPDSWDDSIVHDKVKSLIDKNIDTIPKVMKTNLEVDLRTLHSHENAKNHIFQNTRLPLFLGFLSFLLSIFFLPFTVYIQNTIYGLLAIILIVLIDSITIWLNFIFIKTSVSLLKR
jgi:hypothetical protein